jgi:hypothetical protein
MRPNTLNLVVSFEKQNDRMAFCSLVFLLRSLAFEPGKYGEPNIYMFVIITAPASVAASKEASFMIVSQLLIPKPATTTSNPTSNIQSQSLITICQ